MTVATWIQDNPIHPDIAHDDLMIKHFIHQIDQGHVEKDDVKENDFLTVLGWEHFQQLIK